MRAFLSKLAYLAVVSTMLSGTSHANCWYEGVGPLRTRICDTGPIKVPEVPGIPQLPGLDSTIPSGPVADLIQNAESILQNPGKAFEERLDDWWRAIDVSDEAVAAVYISAYKNLEKATQDKIDAVGRSVEEFRTAADSFLREKEKIEKIIEETRGNYTKGKKILEDIDELIEDPEGKSLDIYHDYLAEHFEKALNQAIGYESWSTYRQMKEAEEKGNWIVLWSPSYSWEDVGLLIASEGAYTEYLIEKTQEKFLIQLEELQSRYQDLGITEEHLRTYIITQFASLMTRQKVSLPTVEALAGLTSYSEGFKLASKSYTTNDFYRFFVKFRVGFSDVDVSNQEINVQPGGLDLRAINKLYQDQLGRLPDSREVTADLKIITGGFEQGYNFPEKSARLKSYGSKLRSRKAIGFRRSYKVGKTVYLGHIVELATGGYLVFGKDDYELKLFRIDFRGNLIAEKTHPLNEMKINFFSGHAVPTRDGGAILLAHHNISVWDLTSKTIKLIKFDAKGELLWKKTTEFEKPLSYIKEFYPLKSGGFILGVNSKNPERGSTDSPAYAIRFSEEGDALWRRNYDSSSPAKMIEIDEGNIFLTRNNKVEIIDSRGNIADSYTFSLDTYFGDRGLFKFDKYKVVAVGVGRRNTTKLNFIDTRDLSTIERTFNLAEALPEYDEYLATNKVHSYKVARTKEGIFIAIDVLHETQLVIELEIGKRIKVKWHRDKKYWENKLGPSSTIFTKDGGYIVLLRHFMPDGKGFILEKQSSLKAFSY